jgi:hypothetical protein
MRPSDFRAVLVHENPEQHRDHFDPEVQRIGKESRLSIFLGQTTTLAGNQCKRDRQRSIKLTEIHPTLFPEAKEIAGRREVWGSWNWRQRRVCLFTRWMMQVTFDRVHELVHDGGSWGDLGRCEVLVTCQARRCSQMTSMPA